MQHDPEAQAATVPPVELDAASAPVSSEAASKPLLVPQALDAWNQMMLRVHRLLREKTIDAAWVLRLTDLTTALRQLAARDPDLALYVLIEANGSNAGHYSSQHAMTCMVIAELAAEWMEWPEEERRVLALAAVSMNLSITALQDSLAKQSGSMSDGQRQMVAVARSKSPPRRTRTGFQVARSPRTRCQTRRPSRA